MSKLPLLLEIGVEELPSSFVDAALAALPKIVTDKLAALRLPHGTIRPLGTPRRLSVLVDDVATSQADLDEEVVGPPESAAYKDGKPTKAAEAFAQKLGITVDAIQIVEREASAKQKAGRYLVGRKKEKGREARELLGQALAEICAAIPFRKSMRWGDGDATFGRPVQWLVALFGADVIDVAFAGARSGRVTRGHRFLAPAPFELAQATDYADALKKAHVLVDRKDREAAMMARVDEAAKKLGGAFVPDAYLVDENASLVEEPHVISGSFDPKFLDLPRELIVAVARGHQKYFCVEDANGQLLPHYLAVVNTALAPANIVKMNDRTMGARLSDARFFSEEDKKHGFPLWNEKIGTIVFHARLGSVKEKVERLVRLVGAIAKLAKIDDAVAKQAEEAAALCKSDLASLMVGEFPELQGQMGTAYALADGRPKRVADAIRDHYKPVGAEDSLPQDDVAALVALADRLDTLTGCFAVGLAPTGSADPYALRRNCIAALRLLAEHRKFESLRWSTLIRVAYNQFEGQFAVKKADLDENATIEKVTAFASDRLRGILAAKTSGAVADAVLESKTFIAENDSPDVIELPAIALFKAKVLHSIAGEAWIERARAVGKRLRGISKDAKPVFHDLREFGSDSGNNARIVIFVETLRTSTADWRRLQDSMKLFENFSAGLAQVFDEMLINDPNDPNTAKRLELLSFGAACMLRIADFSRLA